MQCNRKDDSVHYVLSDIHGDRDAFDTVLTLIGLRPDDHLYILGDVIDRGQYGIELLQRIRSMENCTLLLGNHEHMMINALRHPEITRFMRIWQNNDCDYTYQQFQKLSSSDQEDILQYLESLPVQMEVEVGGKQFVLVHAAPMELYERLNRKYSTPTEFAVWHRLRFESNLLESKTVVFGHTPTKHVIAQEWPTLRIFHNNDAINIDCGCAYPGLGGQLGCLRLDDMTEFYSAEGVVTAQKAVDWKREMQKKWEENWNLEDDYGESI